MDSHIAIRRSFPGGMPGGRSQKPRAGLRTSMRQLCFTQKSNYTASNATFKPLVYQSASQVAQSASNSRPMRYPTLTRLSPDSYRNVVRTILRPNWIRGYDGKAKARKIVSSRCSRFCTGVPGK